MVLVNDIIYFFNHEETFINFVNLTRSIDGKYYCLIPYKIENNALYYLISYPKDPSTFGLFYFKFHLTNPNSCEIISN